MYDQKRLNDLGLFVIDKLREIIKNPELTQPKIPNIICYPDCNKLKLQARIGIFHFIEAENIIQHFDACITIEDGGSLHYGNTINRLGNSLIRELMAHMSKKYDLKKYFNKKRPRHF